MNANTGLREEAVGAFLRKTGWGHAARQPLPGDASTRHYVRLVRGNETAMLMDQPQSAEAPTASVNATPEERRALGYNSVARLAGADCARFVAAASFLRSAGLTAPDIYAADTSQGFLLLEDLGDDLYSDAIASGADEGLLYGAAIDALAVLHRHAAPDSLNGTKPLFRYDETALVAETDLLTEWFLPAALRRPVSSGERDEHRGLWRAALKPLHESSRVFVHRDYHAQNLLWLPQRTAHARVGLIDFQDAVAGSPAYDLVSLLEDARRDVPQALAAAMTEHYLAQMNGHTDPEQFRMAAALLAAQRNAKIIGIFARLSARDKKPRYLAYLPRVWGYMQRDLQHPALAALKIWYDRMVPPALRGAFQA
jgi:aminoglycoside/choline kinase family phosphotransferase